MLIGLNVLKTVAKAPILDAWFHADDSDASPAEETGNALLDAVNIRSSLRHMPVGKTASAVPAMPRFAAQEQKPEAVKESAPAPIAAMPIERRSPYQKLSDILDSSSASSAWLESAGLLNKFMSTDCFVDMTMTSEGGVTSVLRSSDGFRRTVMCRADGYISQRITSPSGEELVRFSNTGEVVLPGKRA